MQLFLFFKLPGAKRNLSFRQPDEGKIANEIENLRKEFYAVTEERRKMEAQLNDITNPER